MTKSPIKVVRPWPAEQPRPPVVHRGDRIADLPKAANTHRRTAAA